MYFIHDFFCFVLFCFLEVSSFGEAQGWKLYLDWVFFLWNYTILRAFIKTGHNCENKQLLSLWRGHGPTHNLISAIVFNPDCVYSWFDIVAAKNVYHFDLMAKTFISIESEHVWENGTQLFGLWRGHGPTHNEYFSNCIQNRFSCSTMQSQLNLWVYNNGMVHFKCDRKCWKW